MIGIVAYLLVGLAPCPSSPNCVSSEAVDKTHEIAPFPVITSAKESIDRLSRIIEEMPRTQIVEKTPDYLHAEFESRIFHFVDDVEFLYDPNKEVIQVRSASRVGYGDLGVNRKRVETIRKFYLAK